MAEQKFINDWFKSFEAGMEEMNPDSREKFFKKCGSDCVKSGIINLYEDVFSKSDGDLDKFFENLNNLDSIGGQIIQRGKTYEIFFDQCYCNLHIEGYVQSDVICECSKQSVLYVMAQLAPQYNYEVTKITSVLGGDDECRFRIAVVA